MDRPREQLASSELVAHFLDAVFVSFVVFVGIFDRTIDAVWIDRIRSPDTPAPAGPRLVTPVILFVESQLG